MHPVLSVENPAQPVKACAFCGWVEMQISRECRSCGHLFEGAGASVGTASFSAAKPLTETGQTGQNDSPPFAVDSRPSQVSSPAADPALSPWPKRLLVMAALWGVWVWSSGKTVSHPPGILIASEPSQQPVPAGQAPWTRGETQFIPLASYDIKARVVHLERYRWDAVSDLAPVDVGVGWGVMSDELQVSRCQFYNTNRYLSWNYQGDDFPADASRCMSNMHMIPASDAVRERLLDLQNGTLFEAKGYLVEVRRPGMNPWTSSLSRNDTGNGACEIMWIESLEPLH